MLHKLFWMALAFGLAFAIVGCSDSYKTVNPQTAVINDGIEVHDPPEVDFVVSDTIIDYTDEVRAFAPWALESSGNVAYRLSNDTRTAVWLEALYALCGSDFKVGRAINGMAAGDNNYCATDLNAYNYIKSHYGTAYASVWSLYFSNINSYAFYGGFGRGGQCRGFANLIWYRGTNWHNMLYSYQTFIDDYAKPANQRRWTKPYNQARRGDIIQYRTGHTAVVEAILGGTEGSSVYSVDVIDANWVGGDGQEIIGRHPISRITSGSGNGGINDLDQYIVIDCIAAGVR
ncbi:MAG: hypothetical protein WC495_00325 [Patescibacteria group bacterium]|jgi:hypothetical protein